MRNKRLNQKGFTLVELVIAISIATLVVAAAVAIWFQLTSVSARNSDYMAAYGHVQNAGYWFSRDGVQAQEVQADDPETPEIEPDDLLTPEIELLILDWVDWEGVEHNVVYTLEGDPGELRRTVDGGSPILVAQYIDPAPAKTSCTWDGETLTLEITAQVGDNSATRTYKAEPRAFFGS